MSADADLTILVGRRIAGRRAELGLTLEAVAAGAGVSRAMVSRIERGEVNASAVVLDRLANGLGLTLSALFSREAASPLARRDAQPVWRDPATGYHRREVAPLVADAPARLVEIVLPAGAEVAFPPQPGRPLRQLLWLLEGEVEVETAGTVHRLAPGDCLAMRAGAGNTFRNPTDRAARYAVVLTLEPAP